MHKETPAQVQPWKALVLQPFLHRSRQEIACPRQAYLELYESRPEGNGWNKSPCWRWHTGWCRRVTVKLRSPGTWTFSQRLGLLIPKAQPATGRSSARENYAVKLLIVLFLTDQLWVSPFWRKILLLVILSAPHFRGGDLEKEFANLSTNLP